MTTATKNGQEEKITALYARLSDDDPIDKKGKDGDAENSNSIQNQRTILYDYARKNGYLHPQFFSDDGVSGTTFEREGFKEMEKLVEEGKISTIIVKDLSRFGRNYLEVGNYLEMIYPSLGVKFIAIQENVDTLAGTGTEMMPFRKIFALCLAGCGPFKIAKQLEAEKILTPTAYFNSIHRPASNKAPANPYRWSESTVENILANRQYTGCTVNFMTTSVSYKVHKTVYRPENEWQIIPDTQDAIIDENTWLRVQKLRKNKRRPTATGRKSLFSGLVFCPDCGAKLHFCAAKSLRRDQEFFRCANYKDRCGECTIHFIRDVVLEKIVHEAISSLADFVRCYESVFLFVVAKQNSAMFQQSMQETKRRLEKKRRRVDEIDCIITRLYEDNIAGKLNDERFSKMSAAYEAEQKELELSIAACEQKMKEADKAKVDLRMLLNGLREFTELRDLTPIVVNTVIQRIEVHNSDRSSGHIRVKVDIYFTAARMIDLPAEEEIRAIEEELRANPQKYRLSA